MLVITCIGSLYQLSCGVTSGGIDDRASAVFPSAIIGVGGRQVQWPWHVRIRP